MPLKDHQIDNGMLTYREPDEPPDPSGFADAEIDIDDWRKARDAIDIDDALDALLYLSGNVDSDDARDGCVRMGERYYRAARKAMEERKLAEWHAR